MDLNSTSILEVLSTATDYFYSDWPTLLLYVHIIIAAVFPIYTGAHASLSRPASAAKPKKEEGEEHEDEDEQIMEGLTASDAIIFPVTAGLVLATLYWLIKRYGADMVNLILAWYFAAAGIFSTAQLCSDAAAVCISMILPSFYMDSGLLFEVRTTDRQAVSHKLTRTTPLPGLLGRLPLPEAVKSSLWRLKHTLNQQYAFELYIAKFTDIRGTFGILDVFGISCGIAAVLYNNFVSKPWWLTNIQGFGVSYFALQLISPTSFVVGSLVLSGLFFYDIWAVFFTPLMVTVATSIDQPIKLLFPRPDGDQKAYSMLGLGDIVLPGLMIGLALRFDLFMYYKRMQTSNGSREPTKVTYTPTRGHWASRCWTALANKDALPTTLQNASFPKPYFTATLVGYVVGMIMTLAIMTVYQHAQPALLYLVPAVLSSLWGTAAVRGELRALWEYSEELNGEALEEGKTVETDKPSIEHGWSETIFIWLGLKADEKTPAQSEAAERLKAEQQKHDEERAGQIVKFLITVKEAKKEKLAKKKAA